MRKRIRKPSAPITLEYPTADTKVGSAFAPSSDNLTQCHRRCLEPGRMGLHSARRRMTSDEPYGGECRKNLEPVAKERAEEYQVEQTLPHIPFYDFLPLKAAETALNISPSPSSRHGMSLTIARSKLGFYGVYRRCLDRYEASSNS
jgi:hypothetical protein